MQEVLFNCKSVETFLLARRMGRASILNTLTVAEECSAQ